MAQIKTKTYEAFIPLDPLNPNVDRDVYYVDGKAFVIKRNEFFEVPQELVEILKYKEKVVFREKN